MSPEDSSLISWVLIIIGIALTFIVYAIYINLRGGKEVKDRETAKDDVSDQSDDSPASEKENLMEKAEQLSSSQNGDEEPEQKEVADAGSNGKQENSMEAKRSLPVVPDAQELIPIATILREADTGRLLVRINDEVFNSPSALKESGNWERVEGLPAEFSTWLIGSPDQTGDDQKAQAKNAAARGDAQKDQDMITQINRIIEDKIRTFEGDQQSVRLVADIAGGLKVLVGVESFPFDDVPYENIRTLIQESVAQWEARQ